ncbi:MAG: GIY-YIG nuclease family protein [Crocinitomicaceae bacterium]|nr:GIY-YIG nuclease family protein [Crocinitomicaceae bacterium]
MIFSIVDIETTGRTPKDHKVIEIAIIKHDGIKELDRYETFVNPEEKINPFISRLTGINQNHVADAPKFYEIAKDIVEFTKDTVFVAHNISFDYGVIKREFRRLGFDYRRNHLCTVQTSKILLPGYDSYGLKNITKSLGIELKTHHRAMSDTEATADLFKILFEKDGENKLDKFIKKEIDPKSLHEKFDIDSFEQLKNKIGIYRLYNDQGQLIYIGKSIHIRKRVEQHLRNNKTKKGLEMREEIVRMDAEETGSELLALLIESKEIKENQPKYNRAQRRNQFTHGLYKYEDENGYINLIIQKVSNTGTPEMLFSGMTVAKRTLEYYVEQHSLCLKLTHLHDTKGECFNRSLKKCHGACVGEEGPNSYNERVIKVLNELKFDQESFLIVDKGRNKKEYSFVWMEEGNLRGYGFILRYLLKRNPKNFKKNLVTLDNNKDYQSIIRAQLNSNEKLEIIPL